MKTLLEWTGERFLPEITGDIACEHIHRYLFAKQYAKGVRVLDIASGEGYGAAMLADVAKSVVGVDICSDAVVHAKQTYVQSNLEYRVGDCSAIPVLDSSIDLVVSFETIEHHDKHEEMLKEIKRVLTEDGILIISSPDRLEYSDMVKIENEFHVKELYKGEFQGLIATFFKNHSYYSQRIKYGSCLFSERGVSGVLNYKGENGWYSSTEGLLNPLYHVAVASDAPIKEAQSSFYEIPVKEGTDYTACEEIASSYLKMHDEAVESREKAWKRLEKIQGTIQGERDRCQALQSECESLLEEANIAREEADKVRQETNIAREEADKVRQETNIAREEADKARQETNIAREEADKARQETNIAREEADKARQETNIAREEADKARQEVYIVQGEATRSWDKVVELMMHVNELKLQALESKVEVIQIDAAFEAKAHRVRELEMALAEKKQSVAQARSDAEVGWKQYKESQSELAALQSNLEEAWRRHARVLEQFGEAQENCNDAWLQHGKVQEELAKAKGHLEAERQYIKQLKTSLSWRITAPMRFVLALVGGLFRLLFALVTFSPARLKRLLEDLRWSRGGSFLYNAFVPEFIKKKLNELWRKAPVQVERSETFFPRPCAASNYLSEAPSPSASESSAVKLLAFYLPQFHPIPENDEWWGEGFTEWTNVAKALPMYIGHDQPKCPTTMGYYDLRLPEVLRKQAELAKQFGITGFCFHHYDFSGRRILETPVDNLIANPDIDIPFCLCWANENWTRRWDGFDQDILLAQDHSPEDDVRFIESLMPYFADSRYIHKDGKPFFIVYKPEQFPDMRATLARWRDYWKSTYGTGLYIVMAQSFGAEDPREYGFDAAVQFPPHRYSWDNPRLNGDLTTVEDFSGQIFDYEQFAESYMVPSPEYVLYKTVSPAWDNSARRGVNSTIFANSSPEAYAKWLRISSEWTVANHPSDSSFLFVNAWNEWAEGAYLEPDRTYGHAYLNATSRVLAEFAGDDCLFNQLSTGTVLFVTHDTHVGGAQVLLLSILKWFAERTWLDIKVLSLGGGVLMEEFKAQYPTVTLEELNASGHSCLEEAVVDFCGGKPNVIFANTVVSGRVFKELSDLGVGILTYIHELEKSIEMYAKDCIDDVLNFTSHFIAGSPAVAEYYHTAYGLTDVVQTVIPASIPERNDQPSLERKMSLREALGLPADALIVTGCGMGILWRKGADLFVETALKVLEESEREVVFLWVGDFDAGEESEGRTWSELQDLIRSSKHADSVRVLGVKDNFRDYIEAADIFYLSSREDPFPLVSLEAAEREVPVICFAESGGIPEFVEDDAGFVVDFGDAGAAAESILALSDDGLRRKMGRRARSKLLERHTVAVSARRIYETIISHSGHEPLVSVIVPAFNHVRYLKQRLESIFQQSFQDFEVILLDDRSDDGSEEVLLEYAQRFGCRYVRNKENSGSPFKQWAKGLELARGRFVWIAEDDDYCENDFLERLLPLFNDKDVKIAYAASHVIDGEGNTVLNFYKNNYYKEFESDRWCSNYVNDGVDEIERYLAVKNTIPNVSGVIATKAAYESIDLNSLSNFKCAGDWYAYIMMMKDGKVGYVAKGLNYHRRHDCSAVARSRACLDETFSDYYKIHKFVIDNFNVSHEVCDKMHEVVSFYKEELFPHCADEDFKVCYNGKYLREKIDNKG